MFNHCHGCQQYSSIDQNDAADFFVQSAGSSHEGYIEFLDIIGCTQKTRESLKQKPIGYKQEMWMICIEICITFLF